MLVSNVRLICMLLFAVNHNIYMHIQIVQIGGPTTEHTYIAYSNVLSTHMWSELLSLNKI